MPRAVIVNTSVLELYWREPDRLNGLLHVYRLYRSTADRPYVIATETTSDTFNHTDTNLMGSTRYSYVIEAVSGAGGTNSTPVMITMPQQTPEGISAPNVTVLGPTQLLVEWESPSQPGGQIDQYHVLLNAGTAVEMDRGIGQDLDLLVDQLVPYTVYVVRIQACSKGVANGCGTGPGTTVRTFEALPAGQQPPSLIAKGPSRVDISWHPPVHANGMIVKYWIYRRLSGETDEGILINVVPGDTLHFSNVGPDLTAYTSYEYKVTAINSKGETVSAWAGVRTLEAAPEVIYAPTVTVTGAYSFSLSWKAPLKTNGVIQIYKIQFEAVTKDPTSKSSVRSVRVAGSVRTTSVSGLQPYTAYQVRVVAVNNAGNVTSGWTRTTTAEAAPSYLQPFTVEKLAKGTSVILRWDPPSARNGLITNYLIYEIDTVNPLYQGLNRGFEMRRLMPYTQYSVLQEACTNGGCARSKNQSFYTAEVAPANQPAPRIAETTSTQAVIHWTAPINPNGRMSLYEVLRRSESRRRKRQLSQPIVVYRTDKTDSDEYTYIDNNLKPYTNYQYKIRGTNSEGSSESVWQSVETDQAAPDGVDPPLVSQVAGAYDQLKIEWMEPTTPNGVIQSYQLQRNKMSWSFSVTHTKVYVDTGLVAYTDYSYVITVCTAGGCTGSAATVARTGETAPHFMAAPTVTTLNSSAIAVAWTKPQVTNGMIRIYHLKVDNNSVYSGVGYTYTVSNLVPYQAYSFAMTACTFGGCTISKSVIGRPDEATPAEMLPPTLQLTRSNIIEVSWKVPLKPNGIVIQYELRRDGTQIFTTITAHTYTDFDVMAGQLYTYRVTAYNSKGSVESPAARIRTSASAPVDLAPPSLQAVSSTSVRATWTVPTNPNGKIYNYTLYVDNVVVFSRLQLTTLVNGLKHWTLYSFRVQACTSSGCVTSDSAQIRTLEDPPLGLDQPKLLAYANSVGVHKGVQVQWTAPIQPNGVILHYEVYRRQYTGLNTGKLEVQMVNIGRKTVPNKTLVS